MRVRIRVLLFAAAILLVALRVEIGAAAESPVRIDRLGRVYVLADAPAVDRQMAETLRRHLEQRYQVRIEVVAGRPEPFGRGIVVGRRTAEAVRAVSTQDFAGLDRDGFIVRAGGDTIVVAGRESTGTVYATYALLRRLGLRFYPWHGHGGLEVFEPLPDRTLQPLRVSEQPHFEYRSVMAPEDRGRYGGTMPELVLGDLLFAHDHPYFRDRGWLGWDHTAAYLVPPARYQRPHPEYFAERPIWDRARPVSNIQTALCMCEPGLDGIAAQRALDWIARQPERRFFAITDGDVPRPQCPRCADTDPYPDYYTDRLLDWVNAVARRVRSRHPDKTLLTLAYLGTVKPPREATLEPNVLVLYAPWYWTSRATSATGLTGPFNVTAKQELAEWVGRFPGQVGVYDYPDDWAWGAAERIKAYAELGIRWVYMNAPRGNLLHWLSSQLLWDPSRDPVVLAREFIEASYGAAAEPMLALSLLERSATESAVRAGTLGIVTDATLDRAMRLAEQATGIAERSDPVLRVRILEGVEEAIGRLLREGRYRGLPAASLSKRFPAYLAMQSDLLNGYLALPRSAGDRTRLINSALGRLDAVVGESGRRLAEEQHTAGQVEARLAESAAAYQRVLRALRQQQKVFPAAPPRSVAREFSRAEALRTWTSEASLARLSAPPALATVPAPSGAGLRGIRINAPFSRLPVVTRGGTRMHAGRFHATGRIEPALEAQGLPFVELHVHASRPVPVTIYLNRRDRLRSDVVLAQGEQIVRIDLRNYWDTRFDPATWDGRIQDVAIDLWPQDIVHPHPPAVDTELTVLGLRATNERADPAALAARGMRGWHTQFAANVPFGDDRIRALDELAAIASGGRSARGAVSSDYLRRGTSERFRSFTEHRILTPQPVPE